MARVSFIAGAAFLVLLAVLHVLRPDLDPSWHFVSEYEVGAFGWMMRLAFVSLAVSCASLALAVLPEVRRIAGYVGVGMLAVSSIGMTMAAVFAPEPGSHLHDIGAMLDLVPLAALFVGWSLWRSDRWLGARRLLATVSWIPLLALVVFMACMSIMLPRNGAHPGPEVLVGWPNRIMILAQCAWLMTLAWHLQRANVSR
ncbi:MAG TPA: DUF998 domain-containing protein [Polyangiaceae bacterium]